MPEKDPATYTVPLAVNEYGLLCYQDKLKGNLPVHCMADRLHRPEYQFLYAGSFVIDRYTPPF